MGLDYSIRIYIKEENLSDANNWLSENTISHKEQGFDNSVSLIFDIDDEILKSFSDLEEYLPDLILENNRIVVGGFDHYGAGQVNKNIYELSFTAVTTRMSIMITESMSVKRWIIEFSKASKAVLALIDKEYSERIIIFYNNECVDMNIKHDFIYNEKNKMENFFNDYFDFSLPH